MKPSVLFIGSIGVVSETSELQRQAYNQALKDQGLNWHWTLPTYKKLLQTSGGIHRLETLTASTGQELSEDTITKIHASKTDLAGKSIVDKKVAPRPGVVDLIRAAKESGAKVAWVTSTSKDNTGALLEAAGEQLSAEDFDHIFHAGDAPQGKPAPDIYQAALQHFGVEADDCVAVEDSINSILSAKGAGIYTIATLGENHRGTPVDNIADAVYASADSIPIRDYFSA